MPHSVLNAEQSVENPDTGIDNRKRLTGNLSGLLADTYLLMVKTHGYHWNVVGPLFVSIHKLTEEHYENLFQAVDDIAERIRALGFPAPSSITEMVGLTAIVEDTENPTAAEMLENLSRDHETLVRRLREATEAAEDLHDSVTADMLTARMAFHEQAIWMLKAISTT